MNPGAQMRDGSALGIYNDLIPDWVRERPKDFFQFEAHFTPLAASATTPTTFQVNQDADFLLTTITGVYSDPADESDTDFPAAFLLTLFDTGSGRQLQSAPIHSANMIGTAQLPYYLPYPKLINALSVINVTAQNLVATAANVRLAFGGFKIFRT